MKPIAQRRGNQAGARRGPDQRERPQRHVDRPGIHPFAQRDVDPKILHRRIEEFLDRLRQPMDLVDEQNRAFFGVGKIGHQILGRHQRRPAGDLHASRPVRAECTVANVVLPSPGGPSNRMCPSVSLRLRAASKRNLQPLGHFALPDHVAHPLRPQQAIIFILHESAREQRQQLEQSARARNLIRETKLYGC